MNIDSQATNNQTKCALVSDDLQDCLKIISAKEVQGLQPLEKFNPHLARSTSNQRLVAAFGHSNSFTAPDLQTSDLFRKGANGDSGMEGKLCLDDGQWENLSR